MPETGYQYETSRPAYEAAKIGIGRKQYEVYEVIRKSKCGVSNKEIARALFWPINTITPRCHELRQLGLVEQAGYKFVDGRKVISWRAV